MFPTSRLNDTSTHGGRIITGSGTRMVNGVPVARISDILLCPVHGPQPIVQTTGGPVCEYLPTAHIGAVAQCGATIITGSGDITQGSGSGGAATAVAERDAGTQDDTPDTDDGLAVSPGVSGGGGSLFQRGRSRALVGDPPGAPSEENSDEPPPVTETPTDCNAITSENVTPSFQLSTNYTLGSVSTQTTYPHTVVAQSGLTIAQIVCNLKAVAENILEPMRSRFGNIRITSGFRAGSGNSQHGTGQAVDIQFPGATLDAIWSNAQWVKDNMPYDQFILEYLTTGTGGRPWFHLSFTRSGNRRQVLTAAHPGRYEPGLKRYY